MNDSEWRRLEKLIARGVLSALRERDKEIAEQEAELNRIVLEAQIRTWRQRDEP